MNPFIQDKKLILKDLPIEFKHPEFKFRDYSNLYHLNIQYVSQSIDPCATFYLKWNGINFYKFFRGGWNRKFCWKAIKVEEALKLFNDYNKKYKLKNFR